MEPRFSVRATIGLNYWAFSPTHLCFFTVICLPLLWKYKNCDSKTNLDSFIHPHRIFLLKFYLTEPHYSVKHLWCLQKHPFSWIRLLFVLILFSEILGNLCLHFLIFPHFIVHFSLIFILNPSAESVFPKVAIYCHFHPWDSRYFCLILQHLALHPSLSFLSLSPALPSFFFFFLKLYAICSLW